MVGVVLRRLLLLLGWGGGLDDGRGGKVGNGAKGLLLLLRGKLEVMVVVVPLCVVDHLLLVKRK